MPAGRLIAGLCLLALSGSASRYRTLPSDAFIWQRRWTPALARAAAENASLFATWHVLAADVSAQGEPMLSRPDWSRLMAGGHAVVPVVRIEGEFGAEGLARSLAGVLGVVAGLPPPLRGRLEIDHDAATAKLGAYAVFLHTLRGAMPPGTDIAATALPTWLDAPGFRDLAGAVDRLVLQVHAVDDPRLGVFSGIRALDAVDRLAGATRTPFLVSLPAYGVRVTGQAGALRVAGEAPLLDGEAGAEIAAIPGDVAMFLDRLRTNPPDTLTGLVWFRLPVDGDARAWSPATIRAVLDGEELAQVALVTRPGQGEGVADILVANRGGTDATLPARIVLPRNCLAADGLGQYVIDSGRLVLRGAGGGLIPPHRTVVAGWMRCDPAGLAVE